MRDKKHQLAMDAAVLMIYNVYKVQKNKQIAGALLMHVKETYDYIF